MNSITIRPKDRDLLIQALRAGVVPSFGQHHIQVGRRMEINTFIADIATICDGGSSFRIVIGEYGAGKTFFLNLVRAIALEKKMITLNADLTPDRRLHATGGQARSLYAELMHNLSSRGRPDGGALPAVVEKFVTNAKAEAQELGCGADEVIHKKLESLKEMVNGFDFANVIAAYCRGYEERNEELMNDAIRWLRGEFTAKLDARKHLNVRTIIDDSNFYDQIKLFARFVRLSGFTGLLVTLDELVNLYKLSNTQARNANFEQILRILNDSLQGHCEGLGFILGGTPEFLTNPRKGLYSYEALKSRLSLNNFAKDGLVDFSGPVIHLSSLTQEDFYLLLTKIRDVFASGRPPEKTLPDPAILAFMEFCSSRIGDAYFRTPRTTITSFINLLAVLDQNEQATWEELLPRIDIAIDRHGETESIADEDDLATFKL